MSIGVHMNFDAYYLQKKWKRAQKIFWLILSTLILAVIALVLGCMLSATFLTVCLLASLVVFLAVLLCVYIVKTDFSQNL